MLIGRRDCGKLLRVEVLKVKRQGVRIINRPSDRRPATTLARSIVAFASLQRPDFAVAALLRFADVMPSSYGARMDEELLYPVCPHRNVPAAFARFNGPDTGGIERFFDDEHLRFLDGLSAVAPAIWLTTRLYGARLTRAWSHRVTHPQLPLLFARQPPLRVWFVARQALLRAGRMVSALGHLYGARLARALRDWAAHPQLPLLLDPQPALALPV